MVSEMVIGSEVFGGCCGEIRIEVGTKMTGFVLVCFGYC